MTMSTDTRELCRRIYDLFSQGQLEAAMAFAADDCEVSLLAFGQTFRGKEGFLRFMKGFHDAFPDIRVTVTRQIVEGDVTVNECTWKATHTGPLMSPTGAIPPTGKPVMGARFCEVWRFRDGKMVELVNYQDASTWLRQLGLVP
jgi:steroid delta-isomerase-like uncharacterized protein